MPGVWGGTNERPGTDHVISGLMRGLRKNCTRWRRQTDIHTNNQTNEHGDSMTESALLINGVRFGLLVFPDNVVLAGLVMDYGLGAATLMGKTSGELIFQINTGMTIATQLSDGTK